MSMVLDSSQVADAGVAPSAPSCTFCAHLRGPSVGGEAWHVVFEDDSFVAVPSLGSLVPGWLLVVPRDHCVNLASLGSESLEQMWEFVNGFSERWSAEFGPIVAFEHGPAAGGRPAGCGVDHGHLHLVPCGHVDLLSAAQRRLNQFDWAPVSGLSSLEPAAADGMDYLYVRSDDEELAVVEPSIPSQALRQVFAAELGSPSTFNWREHPNHDVVRATIARAART